MRKSLWEQMCLRVVGGLANYTKQELRLLLIDLKVSSYFDLFWATRNLQFDLLGLFCQPIGGLWTVRKIENISDDTTSILCHEVKEDGTTVLNHTSFIIVFDPATKRLCGEFRTSYSMELVKRPLKFKSNQALVYTDELKILHRLQPLAPVVAFPSYKSPRYALQNSISTPIRDLPYTINKCLGLFTALYGPHGVEILYLSLKETLATATEDCKLLLEGLKVTGDENMPAGKISFEIDLSQGMDIQSVLEADRRPVFTQESSLDFSEVHSPMVQGSRAD
mmetsp:Transcript_116092/g.227739  ORF Transcript_116092/g.227739 Transcript_116092/m.227739 type:complete len:279 (+) Transcript_116092:3-839(+)